MIRWRVIIHEPGALTSVAGDRCGSILGPKQVPGVMNGQIEHVAFVIAATLAPVRRTSSAVRRTLFLLEVLLRSADSRFFGRVACICVVALSLQAIGAAAGEPVKVQAAQRAFDEACRQEDWSRAVDVGLDLVQMVPDSAFHQYNLACAYALRHDGASSLHWLGRAAASGYADLANLDADADLDSVRDRPGFSTIRAAVAENEFRRKKSVVKRAATSPVLIVAPDGYDGGKPMPLIVAFHGYGDRAAGYPRVWKAPAAEFNAIIAAPQGFRRVGSGFGWDGVDEADAILHHVLDEVGRRYVVDLDRVVLTGFSQGGFIALALGLRHSGELAGVIPVAGPYIPEVDAPQQTREGDAKYYFVVGSRDRAVNDMRRAARDFEAAGFDVKLRIVPGIGHAFPDNSDRVLTEALQWVLKP